MKNNKIEKKSKVVSVSGNAYEYVLHVADRIGCSVSSVVSTIIIEKAMTDPTYAKKGK